MGRLKLTSPGILLILAVVSAGGIFLLDVFYLRPYVESQNEYALRQEAVQAEREARLATLSQEDGLFRACLAAIESPQFQPEAKQGQDSAFGIFVARILSGAGAEAAWLTDEDGKVVYLLQKSKDEFERQSLESAVGEIVSLPNRPATGMIGIAGRPAIFACRAVARRDSLQVGPEYVFWLGRRLDMGFLPELETGLSSTLTFVVADALPPSVMASASQSQAAWPTEDGGLAVAWMAQDATGKPLGYFRANLPVLHVSLQATAARRMVLIMLSLSAGLILLVILGTHILIVGPVIRLLKRLQEMESGQSGAKELTRDLHGEPLVLARRLEAAFGKLAHMSKTDQLTGLTNRRHFEEVLACFYHQARRYSRPLSLMMMDVDFFKAINDTGGHQVGDELLKKLSSIIEQACRKADLPSRLGGDEFAVLLPETAAEDAAAVADRIAQAVAAHPVECRSMKLNVTLSIGVTDLNAGEIDSPEAMLSLADRALYAAKEYGRNRTVQAHDLNGLSISNGRKDTDKVAVLCRKLAGLDTQFKGLFLRAVEEIVELLAQRNPNMADHAHKVKHYSALIAREMGLPDRVIKRIQIAAALHDIGMIAMPDAILLSPGQLDGQQMQTLRRHPLLSVKIMEGMEFLEQEIPAVRYHHERYDGKGYPEGIAGAAVPLTARILAVADAFDAMTSTRTFRAAKSRQQALEEVRLSAGTQFDPTVVEAFLAVAARQGDRLMELTEENCEDLRTALAEEVLQNH